MRFFPATVAALITLFALVLARPAVFADRDPTEAASYHPNLVSRADANSTSTTASTTGKIVADFPLHESCKGSHRLQLARGLFELKRLIRSAADHILLHGNSSELYRDYFGTGSNPATPLGVYERILAGDKSDTLFRCDNPDGNCGLPEWNGHWRGENATGETVICPLSFQTRLNLEKACSDGFTLAKGKVSTYWAVDLFHRTLHLPSLSNELITHEADTLEDILALAKNDSAVSVTNQATLQMFAFEAWVKANIDEKSCREEALVDETDHVDGAPDHDHDHGSHDAAATTSASAAASSSTAAAECHTHADGTQHCT